MTEKTYILADGNSVGYYLGVENDRNTKHGLLYMELFRRAFEADEVVFPGHHFVFSPAAKMKALDLTAGNEMPSADTALFDHPIMTAIFGKSEALRVMAALSQVPSAGGAREAILAAEFAKLAPLPDAAVTVTHDCTCAAHTEPHSHVTVTPWKPLPPAVPLDAPAEVYLAAVPA